MALNGSSLYQGILFIREKGNCRLSRESSSDVKEDFPISGNEARSFYEEIISKPSESKTLSEVKEAPATSTRRRVSKQKKGRLQSHASSHSKPLVSEADIFMCVQNNEVERVNEILSRDASSICVRDQFHWTLLMVASYAGHRDIVELLLKLGAQWEGVVDKKGRNAVDLARLSGHLDIARLMEASHTCHAESAEKMTRKRSRRKSRSQDMEPMKRRHFHCDSCQRIIEGVDWTSHTTSTVHLFNCQHAQHANYSYGISESNRGYQMLLRGGWDPQRGLGPNQQGKLFPVKTVLKQDRKGFGGHKREPRITHFKPNDEAAVRTNRERFRAPETKKRDFIKDRMKDRQWEIRTRAILNDVDYPQ